MPAAVFKQIKPTRLREQAMRLALLNEMNAVAREMKKDFEKTTETWEHKPKFESLVSQAKGQLTVLAGSDDPIYRYVSEGTRPHLIFPRRAKALHFFGTYTAKTVPGVLGSRSGGPGGDEVFSKYVAHPGTEPRHFDQIVERIWRKKFKDRMESAMKKARHASGHAI